MVAGLGVCSVVETPKQGACSEVHRCEHWCVAEIKLAPHETAGGELGLVQLEECLVIVVECHCPMSDCWDEKSAIDLFWN